MFRVDHELEVKDRTLPVYGGLNSTDPKNWWNLTEPCYRGEEKGEKGGPKAIHRAEKKTKNWLTSRSYNQ